MRDDILPMTIPPPLVSTELYCSGILFEETRHSEEFHMSRHSHEEAHMALLFQGTIENTKRGSTSVISASRLMFMPPEETHTTRYSDRVHAFYIRFMPSWWERLPSRIPLLEEAGQYANDPPAWLAIQIHRELQKRDDLTPLMLEGLTMELLVAISRSGSDTSDSNTSRDRGKPIWLTQAQDYLHAHFRESIAVEAIASTVGVHPGHLMRVFRQQYHCTIGDYVRRLRVQSACRLIQESEHPLSQIALSVGFSDQAHFSRTFKAVTGMTPTVWQSSFGDVSHRQDLLL